MAQFPGGRSLRIDNVIRESWIVPGDPVPTPGDIREWWRVWAPVRALSTSPKALPLLLQAMDDDSKKSRTRVMCAEFALNQNPTSQQREHIKHSLMDLASTKKFMYRYTLLVHVLGGVFGGDPEVQNYLLATLEKDEDMDLSDSLLNMFERMKLKSAIPVIERLVKRNPPHKQRTYLVLGGIGGKDAFDVLERSLPNEQDPKFVYQILMAIGATKDARAKGVLLSHLSSQNNTVYNGALEGLSYLGDPSTIPALEKEFLTPGRDSSRFFIKRALSDVKAGGKPYYF